MTYEEQLGSTILTDSLWFSCNSPLERKLCTATFNCRAQRCFMKAVIFLSLMFDSLSSHRQKPNHLTFYSDLCGSDKINVQDMCCLSLRVMDDLTSTIKCPSFGRHP